MISISKDLCELARQRFRLRKRQQVTTPIYHAEFYAGNSGSRFSVPPPNFVIWLLINEKIKSKYQNSAHSLYSSGFTTPFPHGT